MEAIIPTAEVTRHVPGAARMPRRPSPVPGEREAGCALTRRLDGYGHLADQDRAALAHLSEHVVPVERYAILVEHDCVADHAIIVFAGFAARLKRRASGRRQILAYLVPGDLCDRGTLHGYPLNHAIETLTDCQIAKVPRAAYLDLIERHPRIAHAVQRARLAEEAMTHEWIANIGMRSGVERAAYLLCELLERLGLIGQVLDGQFDLPLTPVDLGEALGLSSVHVSRVLQALRDDGLIALQGHQVRILAPQQLRQLAEFEAGYQ